MYERNCIVRCEDFLETSMRSEKKGENFTLKNRVRTGSIDENLRG